MAATPIAALNKTTHVSLFRILSPPFFPFSFGSFGIAEWRRADTIRHSARRRQGARSGLVAVPLFTVECRDLPWPGHRSGATIRASRIRDSGANQESAMGEPVPGTQPPTRPSEDRLDSWKEIAAYLERDVTTVQRWEKREGMPVHRHVHDKMGSVYASRVELDAWALGRNIRAADNGRTVLENETDVAPLVEPISPKTAAFTSRTWWTGVFPLALMAAALVIGTGLWLRGKEYFWRNPIAEDRKSTRLNSSHANIS